MIDVRPAFDDPILDLLPLDVPDSFLTLPHDEQAWRGRFYLVLWAMGYDEWYAWVQVMQGHPDVRVMYDELLAAKPPPWDLDVEIPKMVAGRRRFEAAQARMP